MSDQPIKVEISHRTLLLAIVLVAGLFLTVKILPVLGLVFVAIILASALHPLVTKLHRRRIPKTLAILLVYLAIFLILSFMVFLITPPLVEQTALLSEQFAQQLPLMVSTVDTLSLDTAFLIQQFVGVPQDVLKLTFSFFGNIIGVLSLIVMTFFMLQELEGLEDKFPNWLSSAHKTKASRLLHRFEHQLGGWVRGELVLMFIVGFLSYIGLSVLGIPYALPLAMLAGLLELVPNLGPIIASIPAILVALLISPIHALAVLLLYFLIQQLENNIIVPKVMQKAVGVNPLVSLITLMVGLKLGGIVGAILAIPILVVIQIFIDEFVISHLSSQTRKTPKK